jgi:long-chain acyl-CoA synthetase
MVKTYNNPDLFISYSAIERDLARHLVDYADVETLPEIWVEVAKLCVDVVAVHNPHAKPEVVLTYAQLYEKIQYFAVSLQTLGMEPGDTSALLADNSPR